LDDVLSVAEFDVMKNGMAPEQAIDKPFKRRPRRFSRNIRSSKAEGEVQHDRQTFSHYKRGTFGPWRILGKCTWRWPPV
jgi:hypothetical protein